MVEVMIVPLREKSQIILLSLINIYLPPSPRLYELAFSPIPFCPLAKFSDMARSWNLVRNWIRLQLTELFDVLQPLGTNPAPAIYCGKREKNVTLKKYNFIPICKLVGKTLNLLITGVYYGS